VKVKHDHGTVKIGSARKYHENKKFKKCIAKLTFFSINGVKGVLLKIILNLGQNIEVDVMTRDQTEQHRMSTARPSS